MEEVRPPGSMNILTKCHSNLPIRFRYLFCPRGNFWTNGGNKGKVREVTKNIRIHLLTINSKTLLVAANLTRQTSWSSLTSLTGKTRLVDICTSILQFPVTLTMGVAFGRMLLSSCQYHINPKVTSFAVFLLLFQTRATYRNCHLLCSFGVRLSPVQSFRHSKCDFKPKIMFYKQDVACLRLFQC